MSDGPLVSVVIPCFNGERHVGDAIRSALAQTYRPIEVVVVDDGSTDGSVEVLKSFGDAVRWESGPNRGACAARNRGWRIARGEFVQFLDADDLIEPAKIERQIGLLGDAADACVLCGWKTVRMEDGAEIGASQPGDTSGDSVVYALERSIQTASPLHRRSAVERIAGFDEKLPCAQERDFHIRLACAGIAFRAVPDVLVRARRREGSLSSDTMKVLREHPAMFRRAMETLDRAGTSTAARRRAFAAALARDGRLAVLKGEVGDARRFFALAREIDAAGIGDAFVGKSAWLLPLLGPVATMRLVKQFREESP